MGENSKIEWTDHTFNPWIGCTKVSPACDGCYAEALMDIRLGRVTWGKPGIAGERVRSSATNWSKPLRWERDAASFFAAHGRRQRVFCASLADVFDKQAKPEWRCDLFHLIRSTPNLEWLLLTKRPQNIVGMSAGAGGLPPNAALGTTCEDQTRADINLPHLRVAKGSCRPLFAFVSAEPLLSFIDFGPHLDWLDWVITGGETDQGRHRARPTNPQWNRDIRDQCAIARVAYHHKQNGEWVSVSEVAGDGEHYRFPDHRTVRRVGKRNSGRAIDGTTHDGYPVAVTPIAGA